MKDGKTLKKAGLKLGAEIVEILVGKDQKIFRLHKDRLCELSEYFRGLFKGHFKENESSTATLPEENVIGFELFQYCVYNTSFPEGLDEIAYELDTENPTQAIIHFYVLADQLILDDKFKTQAVHTFTRSVWDRAYGITGDTCCGRELSSADINLGLSLLPEKDPFLKLIIDIAMFQYHKRAQADEFYAISRRNQPREIKVELSAWLEECIDRISISRVAMMFSALAGFTKGWNNSTSPSMALSDAFRKGYEKVDRYKTGYLAPDLEELAAEDDGEGHEDKKVRLSNGQ